MASIKKKKCLSNIFFWMSNRHLMFSKSKIELLIPIPPLNVSSGSPPPPPVNNNSGPPASTPRTWESSFPHVTHLIHSIAILYTHYISRIWRLIITSSWLMLKLFHTCTFWNNLLTRISSLLGTFPLFGFLFLRWKSCLRKSPNPGANQGSFSLYFYLGCFFHGLPTVYSQWI